MENTKSSLRATTVVNGTAQLLSETYIKLKQPMLSILDESWDAGISEYTVFSGSVLVKGTVTHTFNYLHAHGKKAQNEDSEKSNDSDQNGEDADSIKVANGWGEVLDFSNGIVHFHQQVFQFTTTVAIQGVLPGDKVEGTAAIIDVSKLEAAVVEDNGLISGGTQTFKIDIKLSATEVR